MDNLARKANILIVEDDSFEAGNLKLHLQQAGHRVVDLVTSGEAAIVRADQGDIDFLVVDIVLAGELDGIETVRQIHEKNNIPAIFITSYSNDELLLRAEQVRPFAYLFKPYRQREMEFIINMSLVRAQVEKVLTAQKQEVEAKQQHIQEELWEQKELLQRVLENIPYAVFWKDLQSVYLGCNVNFAREAGLASTEAIVGKTDNDLQWRSDTAEFCRLVDRQVMDKREPRLDFEVCLHKTDGQDATVLTSKVPLSDGSGEIIGMLGIFSDITERKRQEEQLRNAQKMDALGKLTGGVAHDYNNMLGVILGYVELLEDQLNEQPKLSKYVHEIRRAGERGAKLTQKLLAFSRQKNSDAAKLDLNAAIHNEQDMLEKTLTARIKLEFDLADDLWPVWLDHNDLEDAIVNLCINAMHAIDGNGQINIQTRKEQIDESDALSFKLKPGDYVQLSVTDSGCGMDEVTKGKVFEPFFSTKGDKGTGLGLSQVYGFVERSGGAIKVYSELDHGTRFVIYFPRYIENKNTTQSTNEIDLASIKGDECILIVDDEPALLELSAEILQRQGYTVHCAGNASQALDLLEKEPIDLVLSDIIMPEMNGYELADLVTVKYPDIKIQLASGFSDNSHVNTKNGDLSRRVLHKPYNSRILLTRIRKLLDDKI